MEEKTQNPNVEPAKEMTEAELSELLQIRRDKLKALQDAGQDPFRKVRYDQQFYSTDITSDYDSFEDKTVSVAGRMMSKRIMGKASFAHILDYKGDIQIYVKRDDIGEESYAQFKTFDIGDIIGVVGRVFKTRTGEISIHAERVELLSKSLRPLPEKFHGLKDPEPRYRQRFVDLIVNPEVRDTFVKRSIIISEMRSWLNNKGFIEVETPVLNTTASGASARPFITHHNTLDIDMYMRIATELHLKMCIVGGLERVYEIGRIFRNEGMDATHNPEFTTIELYQAYTDYKGMMELAEGVIDHCCKAVNGGRTKITYQGSEIDLTAPFKRVTMNDAVREKTGVDFMQYKNMVGAFYQPKLVYMNLSVLQSLPSRQIISGMGEIIKHGLIKDAAYYEWLMAHHDAILALEPAVMEEMIARSCEIKREVVEHDPTEKGERALLNFGHTIGHAIEKLCGFSLYHGECVGLGILAAAYLSKKQGNLTEEQFAGIRQCLSAFGFQTQIDGISTDAVLSATKSDKKMVGNQVKFILLHTIGDAYIYRELSDAQILDGIRYVCRA